MKEKIIVAAFDFDGTITTRDSTLPFLEYTNGSYFTFYKLAKLSPILLKYLLNISSRQQTKECVLKSFFAGQSIQQLRIQGEKFAQSDHLKNIIKPTMLKRLNWHKEQHHRCVLISASIDIYLDPWRKQLGFDDLICSELETINGMITGKLQGLNCWGEEKTRRLNLLLGPKENYTLYAYGDSDGDVPLLKLSDYPFFKREF